MDIRRQMIQYTRFVSSTTNRCDLCVRSWIEHMDTVSETTFFICWPIGGVETLQTRQEFIDLFTEEM